MPQQYLYDINHKFLLGILINFLFIIIEIFCGIQANSMALIADAVHNAGDVIGLVISWAGFRLSQAHPPAKFTYGFKNATILAAFINALLLILTVASLSWEAMTRFGQEEIVASKTIIIVATISILIHGITAWLFLKPRHHDINIQGTFLHMVLDTATSIGVAFGGLLILWKSWTWIDPMITLFIAIATLLGAWSLFKESLNFMLLAVPASVNFEKVSQDLKKFPGFIEYHDLHIWPMSTTETALSVHLVVEKSFFAANSMRSFIQEIQRTHKISHVTIQLETNDPPMLCKNELLKNQKG